VGKSTVIPIQVGLGTYELDVADQLIDWVNQILRPNGGGYSFTTCPQNLSASDGKQKAI